MAYARPGAPVWLIDPKAVSVSGGRPVRHIMKGASEGMRQLVAELREAGGGA